MLKWRKKETSSLIEITISNRTVFRVLAMVIVSLLFLAALRRASYALLLIFTAFFLALALNGPVHWFAEHLPGKSRGSRALATGISFLVIVVLLGGFLASIVPPLVRQTNNFLDAAPRIVEDVRSENSSLGRFVRDNQLEDEADSLSRELGERLSGLGSSAVSTVTRAGSSVFATLTVLVLTFMMLVEGPAWIDFIRRLVPDEHQDHVEELGSGMYRVIRGYVNGQVLLASTAALLILVPLLLLHISYPIALMVIVFICGLIPMVGHYIGAFIVTGVALFSSPVAALIILAYYFVYQQIENYIIQPTIQSNTTNLSPLLVFSSVIVGVSFLGLLGGLIAIPVAGCLKVLLMDYLDDNHLIDEPAIK